LCLTGTWGLGLLASALGQSLPSASQETTLRVETRLGQVNVVVETRKGEPAAGLTRDDFRLSDEGREEAICVFTAGATRGPDISLPALPPNTFSNQLERSGSTSSSAAVILFDGLNTRIEDQAYARAQIQKFLAQLRPEDRVGLYVMGRGPRVLQEITGDSSALLKALAEYRGELNHTLEVPLQDPEMSMPAHFDAWLGELTFGLIDYYARDRALRTVRLLEAIANHLQPLGLRNRLLASENQFQRFLPQNHWPHS